MALGVVRRFESCKHLTQHEVLPHVAYLAEVSVSHPATMPGASRAHHLIPGKAEAERPSAETSGGSRGAGAAASQFALGALTNDVLERIAQLKPIASAASLTLPQLAIAWVLRNPTVSSAIVGATKPEQIAQSASASGVELDDEIVELVESIMEPVVERDPTRIPSQPNDYQKGKA